MADVRKPPVPELDRDALERFLDGDRREVRQGKSLLTDYRDEFGDLDPVRMLRFVAGQFAEAIVERSAARQLAGALRGAVTPRERVDDVRDRASHQALFQWGEEPALVGILNRLCDLYALANIEGDRGWFLEHGRLSGPRSKAITRAVNQLCAEVRQDARVLVDAFGIPDAVLEAPIAIDEP